MAEEYYGEQDQAETDDYSKGLTSRRKHLAARGEQRLLAVVDEPRAGTIYSKLFATPPTSKARDGYEGEGLKAMIKLCQGLDDGYS
ncbi:uncharacterized protein LOC112271014 isoform X2 [Brachypodium distachyon]|uniref:uncharacterized protein LOC112271014 isoform X2 n=1 Tax=Brachypodium distachyon TaxID=15368 RepID=UPI000D0DC859|nr:uncharacterized protein LOC112271014 isoform X2 [Brachypodium distachyon]|eukprot:XP_024315660.1 uncharacterized protein LOC112271014 isoform X2 [Brachypodium distachyon]